MNNKLYRDIGILIMLFAGISFTMASFFVESKKGCLICGIAYLVGYIVVNFIRDKNNDN